MRKFDQMQTTDGEELLLCVENIRAREEGVRFVSEIHDHTQKLKSGNELLATLHESGRNEEGKVTRSHKKETSAGPVILAPRASLFTKRTTPTNEKKRIIIHAHSRYGRDLAVSVSKFATTMLRLF